MKATAILNRLRELIITELADLWALRQRRKMKWEDKADFLSPEAFAFWMKRQERKDARGE